MHVIDRPSPNFNDRPTHMSIDMLVLHYTQMESADAALERMCDEAAEVSAHYLVDLDGLIYRLVPEEKRAWHAGLSFWLGERDINGLSIGIELQNGGHDADLPAYTEAQMQALRKLAKDIVERHGIKPQRVLGHSDVAPDRKEDPGEHFDWGRLARSGVGLWRRDSFFGLEGPSFGLGDEHPLIEGLQEKFVTFGYGLEKSGIFGKRLEQVVTAFQRHYRPHQVDGRADAQTVAILDDLLDQMS